MKRIKRIVDLIYNILVNYPSSKTIFALSMRRLFVDLYLVLNLNFLWRKHAFSCKNWRYMKLLYQLLLTENAWQIIDTSHKRFFFSEGNQHRYTSYSNTSPLPRYLSISLSLSFCMVVSVTSLLNLCVISARFSNAKLRLTLRYV